MIYYFISFYLSHYLLLLIIILIINVNTNINKINLGPLNVEGAFDHYATQSIW